MVLDDYVLAFPVRGSEREHLVRIEVYGAPYAICGVGVTSAQGHPWSEDAEMRVYQEAHLCPKCKRMAKEG